MSHPAVPEVRATESTERYFADIYDYFVKRLVTIYSCSRDDAEDAMQVAFMQFVQHPPHHENIEAWLWTVAKHDLFRTLRGPRVDPIEAAEEAGLTDPALPDDASADSETLRLVLKLKSQQQTCLIMKAFGFSYAEIGEQTGQTYTWVNRHMTEGRRALRALARESESA